MYAGVIESHDEVVFVGSPGSVYRRRHCRMGVPDLDAMTFTDSRHGTATT